MEKMDLEVFEDQDDQKTAIIIGDLNALQRLVEVILTLTENPGRVTSVGIPTEQRGELRVELKI